MPLTPAEALNKVLEDRVASTRITGARTLANLAAADRIQAIRKTSIDWTVDLGGEAASEGPVDTDTTATDTADVKALNLRVGRHRIFHRFNISRVAIQEAASVAPEELANLFGEMTDRGMNAIARKVNSRLYTGDNTAATAEVCGLGKVLDPTFAYGGLAPATYTSWVPIVLDNVVTGTHTPRAFTRDLMLDMDEAVAIQEAMYDSVIMHPTTAKKYQKVYDSVAGINAVINQAEAAGLKRADLGHGGRFYNGYPIIEDPQAPTGQIQLYDMSQLTLFCFELSNTPSDAISEIVINRSYGIPIHIAELPSSNSAVRTFEFYVMPQLRHFNRAKGAMVIRDLS